MAAYRLTKLARRDLEEIWDYIAADSPYNADRVLDEIRKRFELLGRNPYNGRARYYTISVPQACAAFQYMNT